MADTNTAQHNTAWHETDLAGLERQADQGLTGRAWQAGLDRQAGLVRYRLTGRAWQAGEGWQGRIGR